MCSRCKLEAVSEEPDDPVLVQQWLDQQNAWYRETIRTKGWAIQYVFPAAEQSPSLGYTVGLTGFGHPEIAVFGLGQGSAATVLNDLGERVRSGARLRDGEQVQVRGVPVKLFDLPNPAEVVFTANSLYGRDDEHSVPALHAIYPDDRGTWPWEPGCQLPFWLQPMPGQFRA
jgi:hypothetical protein